MGQQKLIYSFVARGTVILADYTEFKGNFISIASQCLQKLPSSSNKFTYNCDGHTFNYLVHDGFTYCVVAVESAGRQLPIAFLERVKDDFNKRYGGGKAATAGANSLKKEFGQLAKVKAQVSEVKGVMMENIEKVLDRGEKIELLVDKTENLRSQVGLRNLTCIHLWLNYMETSYNSSTKLVKSLNNFLSTGFQDTRDQDEEKNVDSEYED
ncbi:hypothetical protein DH2020_019700 [Rehmannia glutinosa]|uniref:Vesicle-associated membrane protein n=1 Tax=Rehmannia glutinosa TaxID=99300 RepID=A0ABR0WGU8_REHGL